MTGVRENIESQLNEVAFVQNLYSSVKISPHNVCEEFQAYVDGKLDDVYNQLTCTVVAKDNNPPVEVEVTLPHTYPHSELRLQASVRGVNPQISKSLHQFLNSLRDEHEPGTYCISFVIDYVIAKCDENSDRDLRDQEPSSSTENSIGTSVNSCRVWMLSHHIYNKVKRRKLLELSSEKSLGGFSLPGKPGVICLEGDPIDCSEAVAVIKGWNWQKIGVKFEEKSVKHSRFNGCFEELTCYKANQGAGERPHMDLGMFFKYLEDLDLGFAFYELFGIQGK